MAYPTVCNACLDSKHERCWDRDVNSEWNETRRAHAQLPADERPVGGAFCICRSCNPKVDAGWYEQVRESAVLARAIRDEGIEV